MQTNQDAADAAVFVSIELDWDQLGSQVSIEGGAGEESEVPAAIRDAAEYGVRFALGSASTLPCSARVTALGGSLALTNPTMVAAAAARAVWRALAFQPSPEMDEAIERQVAASHVPGQRELLRFGAAP